MADSVGDIAVRLSADIAPFQRGMGQASASMGRFEGRSRQMSRTLTNVARASAAAIVGIGAAAVTLASQAARAAVEIENLSRISMTGTTEFQRLAAGAETVGINAEKLADIFRDVQDRVGDFIATGAGPMADFFENIAPQVGVTIEQFARLSGPEALQLYVSSLEQANVTQAEMVFYLEALASDASDLTPLLRDNGAAMRELGDQAERTGRIMSSEAIGNGRELDTVLRQVSGTIRNTLNNALMENSDDILRVADSITDHWIPALQAIVPLVSDIVTQVGQMAGVIASVATAISDMVNSIPGGFENFLSMPMRAPGVLGDLWDGARDRLGRRNDYINTYNDPTPNPHAEGLLMSSGSGLQFGPDTLPPIVTEIPGVTFDSPDNGRGGGGGGSDFRARFEMLQEQLLTEREIIDAEYQARLESLREFREQGVATEEEFNAAEERVTQDHTRRIRDMEFQARQERLAIASGLMGSLATILEAGGNRNLAIVRGLRVAEALIEGYSAAVAAWRHGMAQGGPPLAVAYTAASIARTGAMIAQMKSSSTSGGFGGGGGAAVPAAQSAQPASVSRNVAIQLTGGDMYSRDQVIQLINSINEAVEDGAIVRLV